MYDVAAFDFDGTLTEGGSVFSYLSAVRGRNAVLSAMAPMAHQLAHAAVAGGAVADQTKERLFERVLAGVSLRRAEEVGIDFMYQHLARHLRSTVHRRLEWHLQRGDRVVIVSASPEIYVRVAAQQLGVQGLVATRLAVDEHGDLTGRYEGANCRGDEKIRRLRRWIARSGPAPARVWAYGNSRGDLAMLSAADVGINVGRLGSFGRLRSFPSLYRVETQPNTIRPAASE
jgi:phosphatidylglycerophosphatase C